MLPRLPVARPGGQPIAARLVSMRAPRPDSTATPVDLRAPAVWAAAVCAISPAIRQTGRSRPLRGRLLFHGTGGTGILQQFQHALADSRVPHELIIDLEKIRRVQPRGPGQVQAIPQRLGIGHAGRRETVDAIRGAPGFSLEVFGHLIDPGLFRRGGGRLARARLTACIWEFPMNTTRRVRATPDLCQPRQAPQRMCAAGGLLCLGIPVEDFRPSTRQAGRQRPGPRRR